MASRSAALAGDLSLRTREHEAGGMVMTEVDPDYQDLHDLFFLLVEDVAQVVTQLQAHSSPAMRRALVRAFFSLVEGTTWRLKALVLDQYVDRPELTPAHLALLRDESYDLGSNGEPRTRQRFPSTLDNLRFAFGTAALVTNANWRLDTTSEGWQALQAALKVRNRITHPRTVASCEVSDADMKVVNAAYAWFMDTLHEYFAAPSR